MAIAAVFVAGCSSPWPELPPQRYTGTVVNEATSLPVEGVTIEATRNKLRGFVLKMPSETIGESKTNSKGRFVLTTREGWASWMRAEAPGPYYGALELDRSSRDDLTIKLRPAISTITSRLYIENAEELKDPIRNMVKRVVNYHDKHPSIPYLSMNEYLQRGVATEADLQILEDNHQLFSYPERKGFTNKIFIAWGDRLFVYRDRVTPILFRRFSPDFFDPN